MRPNSIIEQTQIWQFLSRDSSGQGNQRLLRSCTWVPSCSRPSFIKFHNYVQHFISFLPCKDTSYIMWTHRIQLKAAVDESLCVSESVSGLTLLPSLAGCGAGAVYDFTQDRAVPPDRRQVQDIPPGRLLHPRQQPSSTSEPRVETYAQTDHLLIYNL